MYKFQVTDSEGYVVFVIANLTEEQAVLEKLSYMAKRNHKHKQPIKAEVLPMD